MAKPPLATVASIAKLCVPNRLLFATNNLRQIGHFLTVAYSVRK
ncbi:MAG TPA: hypothetical protein PKG56_03095 [Chitinophagaceae bacterium]|nr:hypothetical protein [Chitinophagaceae bacterium]HNL82353.1 hypothetical protein [Chitinophagaceae bacterium]HNM34678.1 hypothetical protein [Chitinophagaceae bacterium]